MTILERKVHPFLQLESTEGAGAPSAWAATDAVRVLKDFDPPQPNVDQIDRMLHQPDFSASDFMQGAENWTFTLQTEMVGAGTADGIPPWSPLVRAAGFARTVSAGNCVLHTPATDSHVSAAWMWQMDGLRHTLVGAYHDITLRLPYNSIPRLEVNAMGFGRTTTATAKITPDYTGWGRSYTILDRNSGDIRFGSSLNATTGAITGGTAFPSKGIPELRIGNQLVHDPLLGGERVYIADRSITAKIELRMTAAQVVTLMSELAADTEVSVSFTIGNAVGRRLSIFGPRVQRKNPVYVKHNMMYLVRLDLVFLSTSSLNDAITIVTR